MIQVCDLCGKNRDCRYVSLLDRWLCRDCDTPDRLVQEYSKRSRLLRLLYRIGVLSWVLKFYQPYIEAEAKRRAQILKKYVVGN